MSHLKALQEWHAEMSDGDWGHEFGIGIDTTGGGSVLKASHSDSTRELELSGTRSELLTLGRKLRSRRGEILLAKVSNPFPYTRSLSRIEIQLASGKIRVSPSGDGETLDVAGRLESLSLLAENIEGFALEADQDDHLHVDYFPEHDYLAEESGSLVVAIDSDVIQAS
jgi:hypothetical protein